MVGNEGEEVDEFELIRQRKFQLDDTCLAIRAIDAATNIIKADATCGGPWAGLLSEMLKRQTRRLAHRDHDSDARWTLTLDGKPRSQSLKERLKRLEPLPVLVIVMRKDNETVVVSGWAGDQDVTAEFIVREDAIGEAAAAIVQQERAAFETLDSSKTEAIKPARLRGKSAEVVRQLVDALPGSAESAADQEERTIRFT